MEYTLSQIFVVLSYIFLAMTYLTKKRQIILFYSIVAVVFNGFSYFFLKAWSGLAAIIVALIRNAIFVVQEKFDKSEGYKYWDYLILAFLLILNTIFAIITYDGFLSLFTAFASVTYTVSIWQKNTKAYKLLGILSSAFNIVYLVFIWSIFGFILESALFIITIVGTVLYFMQNKIAKEKENSDGIS